MLLADDNSRVISQPLPFTLVVYIFKLVLDCNSIINSNQIRYYFAMIERSFCRYSMAFTGML